MTDNTLNFTIQDLNPYMQSWWPDFNLGSLSTNSISTEKYKYLWNFHNKIYSKKYLKENALPNYSNVIFH
jgi:hypothetical protein